VHDLVSECRNLASVLLLVSAAQVFPPSRVGSRAVQAVEVLANSKFSQQHSSSSSGSSDSKDHLQRFTYTFVLERITTGPYRDCWLTVGVRPGNYAV
jgi:hypothetical protein